MELNTVTMERDCNYLGVSGDVTVFAVLSQIYSLRINRDCGHIWQRMSGSRSILSLFCRGCGMWLMVINM